MVISFIGHWTHPIGPLFAGRLALGPLALECFALGPLVRVYLGRVAHLRVAPWWYIGTVSLGTVSVCV